MTAKNINKVNIQIVMNAACICKHAGSKLKTNRFDSSDRQRDYHTDIGRDILDVFMGRGEGFHKSVQLTVSVNIKLREVC